MEKTNADGRPLKKWSTRKKIVHLQIISKHRGIIKLTKRNKTKLRLPPKECLFNITILMYYTHQGGS